MNDSTQTIDDQPCYNFKAYHNALMNKSYVVVS